jgi:NAD(P) transhydrogenase subunit alpha
MHQGSVIVDLAAEQGGNCALTERDQVVEKFGVTIIGYTDLPSRMARQASELYATTVYNLVEDLCLKTKEFSIDVDDEVQRGALVLLDGRVMWPPPVRPKPRAGEPRPEPTTPVKAKPDALEKAPRSEGARTIAGFFALAFAVVGIFAPPDFLEHFTVFLLACVVGWHVVWNVTPALHTPLMSVTNAISGIILIGGILVLRGDSASAPALLGGVAILLAAINVSGGFLVTQRMLRMFQRR